MNLPVKTTTTSLLMDPESFNHMQRVGGMLALSPLFPDHLRKGSKETAIANGVLVMNMAARLGEDPLTVAQNIYFVSGKPGWSSSYMIGKANQHGVFKDPISWEIKGKGETLSVTAFGDLASTGKRVEVTCDMAMAKAEGWTSNKKYQSMPEQMLRYRSATFLIRLYCPEVMVGVPAQVEVELGMKDVTPDDYADYRATTQKDEKPEPIDVEMVDTETGEVTEDAPKEKLAVKEEPKPQAKKEPAPEKTADKPVDETEKPEPDKKESNAPDLEQFDGLVKMIIADMHDGFPVGEVAETYQAQIDQMEKEAPDAHKTLMAEMDACRKAQADKAED